MDLLDEISLFFVETGKSRRQVARKLKEMALISVYSKLLFAIKIFLRDAFDNIFNKASFSHTISGFKNIFKILRIYVRSQENPLRRKLQGNGVKMKSLNFEPYMKSSKMLWILLIGI